MLFNTKYSNNNKTHIPVSRQHWGVCPVSLHSPDIWWEKRGPLQGKGSSLMRTPPNMSLQMTTADKFLYWAPKDDIGVRSYHISFLREDSIIQTLQSHPLNWQLHWSLSILFLSAVVLGIDILSETKIRHFYHIIYTNPAVVNKCRKIKKGRDRSKHEIGCT